MIGYVTLKHQPVLYPPLCVCVPCGQTRDSQRGTEAKFLCISPHCSESEVWAMRDQLSTPPTPTTPVQDDINKGYENIHTKTS
jgi:hypothetical protein